MNQEPDYDRPVAYDTQGRPLYLRPEAGSEPQKVEVVKNPNANPIYIPDEIRLKHERSKRSYPSLNLSQGEYVINDVRRHPLGLISIWLFAGLAVVAILLIPITFRESALGLGERAAFLGSVILLALMTLTVLVGAVATMVYRANKFFLTNESVIQHIQTTLFSKNDQIVSLGNIEDASYKQVGIMQTIFGYGSIRLSTQGDETTYRFTWVSNPKKQIDILNNAVEAFKNGHPIED